VTLPEGGGAPGASIQIMQTAPPGYTLDAPLQFTAIATPDGTFRIASVSPGDYTLTARATPPACRGKHPAGRAGAVE
jgi:hypothetical protein